MFYLKYNKVAKKSKIIEFTNVLSMIFAILNYNNISFFSHIFIIYVYIYKINTYFLFLINYNIFFFLSQTVTPIVAKIDIPTTS